MPTDSALLVAGSGSLPLSYTVPNAQEIITLSARAVIDGSAAATAFLPVVQLVSDAGIILAEATTDATVAAGGSAQVSWFPRVGAAASSTGAFAHAGYMLVTQSAAQSVPSGAETLLSFNRGEYDPGDVDLFGAANFMNDPLSWIGPGIAIVTVSISFQAGGAQRYVRLQTTNQMSFADTSIYKTPETVAIGDVASVTTMVQGNATGIGAAGGAPTKLSVKVFQNSGVNKLVSGPMSITMLPSDGLRHP